MIIVDEAYTRFLFTGQMREQIHTLRNPRVRDQRHIPARQFKVIVECCVDEGVVDLFDNVLDAQVRGLFPPFPAINVRQEEGAFLCAFDDKPDSLRILISVRNAIRGHLDFAGHGEPEMPWVCHHLIIMIARLTLKVKLGQWNQKQFFRCARTCAINK